MLNQIDPSAYHEHFNSKLQEVRAGPKEERSCKDLCCVVWFTLLTGFLIVGGIAFVIVGS